MDDDSQGRECMEELGRHSRGSWKHWLGVTATGCPSKILQVRDPRQSSFASWRKGTDEGRKCKDVVESVLLCTSNGMQSHGGSTLRMAF